MKHLFVQTFLQSVTLKYMPYLSKTEKVSQTKGTHSVYNFCQEVTNILENKTLSIMYDTDSGVYHCYRLHMQCAS